MTMRAAPSVLFLTCIVAGCDSPSATDQAAATLVWEAKDAVLNQLKDPDSAQFRNFKVNVQSTGSVCGQVNAKNGFGGYDGFEWFHYNPAKKEVRWDSKDDIGPACPDEQMAAY